MSKVLRVSKHKLDLAQVELTGPSLLIGRSPLCDQILRAPGIKPVHFLLEWIGEGEFNSNEGMWVLFDMAHLLSGVNANNYEDLSAEGILIDNEQQYLGFNWDIVEDRIKATQFNKGVISDQLISNSTKKMNLENTKLALEIVALDKVDQRIKDVWHFFNQFKSLGDNKIPFSIDWSQEGQANFKFPIKPSLILNLKGQKYDTQQDLPLLLGETYIIHFSHEIFFIRFVNRVEYSANHFQFSNNKFTFIGFLSLILFCLILWSVDKLPVQQNKDLSPPEVRVVKVIEAEPVKPVVEVEPPPPPPPPPVIPEPKPVIPEVEAKMAEVEVVKPVVTKVEKVIPPKVEKETPSKVEKVTPPKTEVVKVQKKEEKSTAVAPSFKTENGPERVGLNSPAKVSDVNAVGLLGKVKDSGGSKNNQISAETIGQTFVDNTASGNDNRGVIVRNSQSGILGASTSVDKGAMGSGSNNLMEAQTTLRGAKDFSATNSGPLAKAGALKGKYSIGSNGGSEASGKLSGSASSGGGQGDVDTGGASGQVAGGLTKAQVYKVINAHRREIRTCFESALIVRNDLNGILRLSFGINLAGSVTDVKIVNTELNSNILEGCVVQVIRQMKFPESLNKLSTTVIYPFVFKRSF